jgi:hypothetical protein
MTSNTIDTTPRHHEDEDEDTILAFRDPRTLSKWSRLAEKAPFIGPFLCSLCSTYDYDFLRYDSMTGHGEKNLKKAFASESGDRKRKVGILHFQAIATA